MLENKNMIKSKNFKFDITEKIRVQERANELEYSDKEHFLSIVQGDKRMENMKEVKIHRG